MESSLVAYSPLLILLLEEIFLQNQSEAQLSSFPLDMDLRIAISSEQAIMKHKISVAKVCCYKNFFHLQRVLRLFRYRYHLSLQLYKRQKYNFLFPDSNCWTVSQSGHFPVHIWLQWLKAKRSEAPAFFIKRHLRIWNWVASCISTSKQNNPYALQAFDKNMLSKMLKTRHYMPKTRKIQD